MRMDLGISGFGAKESIFGIFGFNNIKTCSNCEHTDGLYYTSYPPKRKCTIDNNYYECNHQCHIKFVPVIEGKWEQVKCWETKAKYKYSVCGREIMSARKVNIEKYPYCHCGAKMSESEVTI